MNWVRKSITRNEKRGSRFLPGQAEMAAITFNLITGNWNKPEYIKIIALALIWCDDIKVETVQLR